MVTHDPAGGDFDKHNSESFAGWLRMRAEENRRIADLPIGEWPHNPHVLRHLAFRFDQGAALFEKLSKPFHEREPPHCANCSCGMEKERG